MNSRFSECPICSRSFPLYSISSHVEKCLLDGEGVNSTNCDGGALGTPKAPSVLAKAAFPPKRRGHEEREVGGGEGGREKKRPRVNVSAPLADRMRPFEIESMVGQENVVGVGKLLRSLLDADNIPSMVLWGPPGCGKTTLASIVAKRTKSSFVTISAVTSGVADIRRVITQASNERRLSGRATVLFVDEIHRFNKAQQDAFLPHVESGTITLVGATTENPSFECTPALLSRCRVFVLEKLSAPSVSRILRAAITDGVRGIGARLVEGRSVQVGVIEEEGDTETKPEEGGTAAGGDSGRSGGGRGTLSTNSNTTGTGGARTGVGVGAGAGAGDKGSMGVGQDFVRVGVEASALSRLGAMSDGDARSALNALEMALTSKVSLFLKSSSSSGAAAAAAAGGEGRGGWDVVITAQDGCEGLQRTHLVYDKNGEEHYNIISAMHKAVRGSDDNAALYWLARMLQGGESPLYVARRLVRMAAEDIGLADPTALPLAVSAYQAAHFLGKPECDVCLAQCVVHLARAPKSVCVYEAYKRAAATVKTWAGGPQPAVPLHIRNAPTGLMKEIGYGDGYKYNPHYEDGAPEQTYLPPELGDVDFFADGGGPGGTGKKKQKLR